MPVRLLIVKTSSMGDVVHAMPVVNDILRQRADVAIDWLVEAPFAAIPQMHAGIRQVLPMSWRKWRGQLLKAETWAQMRTLRTRLREGRYDLVLDLQGLLKSVLWARAARAPVAGYDQASIREPLAARFYQHTQAVPRELHAVQRCRQLVAQQLGYALPASAPDFGLAPPKPVWKPRSRYAVIIPNASRAEKLWPERHWVAVGRRMLELGWLPVVLWGRDSEQTLAERIAAGCEGDVPPYLKVGEMASVLAGAQHIVGLDTGFTHLAAAFGRPTLGIYCDHEPGLAGITGPGPVASIGGRGQVPSRQDVLALFERQTAALRVAV
ncbi:Lipopolysaccharide heptosyltransferase I [Rubrivivax sp. A210]|uniref:lipopolysaccharide heptosyltransferase I n=1 Tax=Rubrivivax sp. A210 TaxID=2772301 RepID=UPI00191B2BB9|nr:lipopolysaccharide heptosyltransferase I [Rubrivivax sp. A210]CAD5373658.1 Lipopolysaccharide heptosyltransferase I [Rubrivivax sp. A210]